MRNSIATLAYAVAVGIILAVAFHSSAKLLTGAGASAPADTSDVK